MAKTLRVTWPIGLSGYHIEDHSIKSSWETFAVIVGNFMREGVEFHWLEE